MRLSKIATLLSLVSLSACSNRGVAPLSQASQATFVVDPVTADVTDVSADPTYKGLTNARNYRFHACIKDVAELNPVVGASFAVYAGSGKVDQQTTDPSGCIYWSERFSFSPTADETYFELKRQLTATKVHKGSVDLPFAVNPWRKDVDAFRDLRFQPRPAAIRAEGTAATSSASSALLVEAISVQLSFPEGGAGDAHVEIAFSPELKRQGFDGKNLVDALTDGSVSFHGQLVALHGASAELLADPISVDSIPVQGGVARWSGSVRLRGLPTLDPLVELRFQAAALRTPSPLAPAAGRIEVGVLNGPVVSASGAVQPAADGALFLPESVAAAATPAPAASDSRPELFVTSASYKLLGRTFDIDANLNLLTVRRYRFSLVPPSLRRSSWLAPETISNGRFKIRFLLESAELENPTVLDAEDVEADSLGGAIQADVDFHLYDLTQLMGRLRLTMEVMPLDSGTAVTPLPVSDAINLLNDGSLALAPAPGNFDQRVALAPRLQAPAGLPTTDQFAKAFGLAALPASPTDLTAAADALAGGDDSALGKLCSLYYTPGGWLSIFSSYSQCAAHPEDYLVAVHTRHAAKISSAVIKGSPETMSIAMTASFSASNAVSHNTGKTTTDTVSGHVNLGGEVPLLNLAGIHIGVGFGYDHSYAYATSDQTSQSSTQSRSGSLTRNLNADQATFQVKGDVFECVTIAQKDKPHGQGFFHCAREAVPAQFEESYYFIYDQPSASALQDSRAAAAERPFLVLLRGASRFQGFVNALENSNVSIALTSAPAVPTELRQGMPGGSFDGLFPGLLSDSLGTAPAPAKQ